MKTILEREADIAKRLDVVKQEQAEIAREKERLRIAAQHDPLVPLAEYLHSKYCSWNHTDGCAWMYGTGGDPRGDFDHSPWLQKAQDLLDDLEELGFEIS